MNFNIAIIGTGGKPLENVKLGKTVEIIQKSLSACGHSVRISLNQFDKNSVNLIFDGGFTPEIINFILDLRQNENMKIGLYLGELYINGWIPYAWDGFVDTEKDQSNIAEILKSRVESTYFLASRLDFCWSALERSALEFSKFNPASFFFPSGHTDRLDPEFRKAEKDIDVIFVGTATDHRRHWISEIQSFGVNIRAFGRGFPDGFLPDLQFGNYLDRSKIALNLTFSNKVDPISNADMRFASNDRLVQYLERDLCVVSEDIPVDNPYSKFTVNGAPYELGAICRDLLTSGAWKRTGVDLSAKFRRELNAKNIVGPVINKTLAAIFPSGIPNKR